MNSFIDTLLDFYHRCGTILWKATVEGRVFCKKKAIFVEHIAVAASRGILRTLSKV